MSGLPQSMHVWCRMSLNMDLESSNNLGQSASQVVHLRSALGKQKTHMEGVLPVSAGRLWAEAKGKSSSAGRPFIISWFNSLAPVCTS